MNKRTKTGKTPVKQNKGITLIALVITIIVMLILVVVTVNIAMDGGLFTKAKDAGDETTVEAEKETLTNIVLGKYEGENAKVNLDEVYAILNPSGQEDGKSANGKWQNASKGTLEITPPEEVIVVQGVQSNKWYAIRQSGTVLELNGELIIDPDLETKTIKVELNGEKNIILKNTTSYIKYNVIYGNAYNEYTPEQKQEIKNVLLSAGLTENLYNNIDFSTVLPMYYDNDPEPPVYCRVFLENGDLCNIEWEDYGGGTFYTKSYVWTKSEMESEGIAIDGNIMFEIVPENTESHKKGDCVILMEFTKDGLICYD